MEKQLLCRIEVIRRMIEAKPEQVYLDYLVVGLMDDMSAYIKERQNEKERS